jgi:hypothetical protein
MCVSCCENEFKGLVRKGETFLRNTSLTNSFLAMERIILYRSGRYECAAVATIEKVLPTYFFFKFLYFRSSQFWDNLE